MNTGNDTRQNQQSLPWAPGPAADISFSHSVSAGLLRCHLCVLWLQGGSGYQPCHNIMFNVFLKYHFNIIFKIFDNCYFNIMSFLCWNTGFLSWINYENGPQALCDTLQRGEWLGNDSPAESGPASREGAQPREATWLLQITQKITTISITFKYFLCLFPIAAVIKHLKSGGWEHYNYYLMCGFQESTRLYPG